MKEWKYTEAEVSEFISRVAEYCDGPQWTTLDSIAETIFGDYNQIQRMFAEIDGLQAEIERLNGEINAPK